MSKFVKREFVCLHIRKGTRYNRGNMYVWSVPVTPMGRGPAQTIGRTQINALDGNEGGSSYEAIATSTFVRKDKVGVLRDCSDCIAIIVYTPTPQYTSSRPVLHFTDAIILCVRPLTLCPSQPCIQQMSLSIFCGLSSVRETGTIQVHPRPTRGCR